MVENLAALRAPKRGVPLADVTAGWRGWMSALRKAEKLAGKKDHQLAVLLVEQKVHLLAEMSEPILVEMMADEKAGM